MRAKAAILFVLFLAPILAIAQAMRGTTGAYILRRASEDTIWLGVDSKIRLVNEAVTDRSIKRCKFYCYKNCYFVGAGIISYKDTTAYNLVREAVDYSGSYAEQVDYLKHRLTEFFTLHADSLIKWTGIRLREGSAFLSTVFCRFENGKVKLSEDWFEFYRNADNRIEARITHEATDSILKTSGGAIKCIGYIDSSLQIQHRFISSGISSIVNDPSFNVKGDKHFKIDSFGKFVYYLVYVETIHDSSWTGEPITVAQITKDGLMWIYNDVGCKCQ